MNRHHSIALRVVAVVLLGGSALVGCGAENTGMEPNPNQLTLAPTTTSEVPTTTTTAPSSSAPTSASKRPGTTPKAPPAPQPVGGGRCAGFPAASCTGVPAGTSFKTHSGNLFIENAGAVIDGMHITGDVIVRANGVLIRNSQIDGMVLNFDDRTNVDGAHPFTIRDSTVGTDRCNSGGTAIGTGNFTAERVYVRGFGDAIRAGAPNVTVRDSLLKMCTNDPSTHADGIQDYPGSTNVVFDHNTVDLCGGRVPSDGHCDLKSGYNAPIFVASKLTKGARITNNLVMGGVYSLYTIPYAGAWTVSGNRVVKGTWTYGPAHTEGNCGLIAQWSDNSIVTIDASYRITSTVGPLGCPA